MVFGQKLALRQAKISSMSDILGLPALAFGGLC
jgi:hypothetical protein